MNNKAHLTLYIEDLVSIYGSLDDLKQDMVEGLEFEWAVEVRNLQDQVKLLSNRIFEIETPSKDAAVVAVFDKDNKILLLKRGSTAPTFPNCWDMPGGVIDDNETPLSTIAREVKEETGLDIKWRDFKSFSTYKMRTRKGEVYAYHTKLLGDCEIKIDWEHSEFKWFTEKEIEDLGMIPLQKDIVKEIYPIY